MQSFRVSLDNGHLLGRGWSNYAQPTVGCPVQEGSAWSALIYGPGFGRQQLLTHLEHEHWSIADINEEQNCGGENHLF